MKRFLLAAATILLCISAGAGNITRDFTGLDSFFGIDISSNFDITLQQGQEYSATVVIDTDIEQYLNVNVRNNILYVSIKGAPTKLVNQINSLSAPHPTLTITMPDLSSIHLSGSCTLTSEETFQGLRGEFDIFLSGASSVDRLSVAAGELDMDVSGTSKACILADCSSVEIEAAGMASISVTGNCDEYGVEASGSAKVTLVGSASELECECSGASHLDSSELTVDKADIECSGASTTKINVEKVLEVSLSGVSTCLYKSDNKNLKIIPQVGRAASLKRL